MDILGQDIRYSLRMLVKSPVTTAVAILSLALGIGANTAIFSLLNVLIVRPLPIRDPGQLVRLSSTTPRNPDRESPLSLAMYQEIRKDQRVFSDLFAWTGGGIVNIEANGAKYAASMSTVTGEYFSTLGIQPLLGRLITPDDLSLDSGLPAAVAVIASATVTVSRSFDVVGSDITALAPRSRRPTASSAPVARHSGGSARRSPARAQPFRPGRAAARRPRLPGRPCGLRTS